ncbi:Calx-beta domain-containing protein [Candidatus Poriferisodalis sp.]|uniref:Calx-beta domain-containing protein n=1 Tax=Candidatus Poriferisodalis sp. TaxID=3101277 RepID=UPI003B028807
MRRRPHWRRCLAVLAAAVLAAAGVVLPPGGVPPAEAAHNAHLTGLTLEGSATRGGETVTFTLTATEALDHSPSGNAKVYTVHVPHDLATIKFTPTWTDTGLARVNLSERRNSSGSNQNADSVGSVSSSGSALTTGSTPRWPSIVVVPKTGGASQRIAYYFNLEYDLLVSNFGQTASSNRGNNGVQSLAQLFTTGSASGGYSLEGVEVEITNSPTSSAQRDDIKAELWSVSGGTPNEKVEDLTVPAYPIAAGPVTFAAPDNTTLSPSTTYALVLWTTDNFNPVYTRRGSGNEDAGAAAGWSIANALHWIADPAPPWDLVNRAWGTLTANQPLSMRVTGAEAPPQLPVVEFSPSQYTVSESDGSATLMLSVSPAPAADLSVSVSAGSTGDATRQTTAGSCQAGSDWILNATTVTVTAGETSASWSSGVTICDDSDVEADESFTVDVGAGTGYTVGTNGSAEVTINDNDTPAAPSGLAASGNAQLAVSWTAPGGVLSGYDVHYTSNASVGDGAVASGNDASAAWVVASDSVSAAATSHTISPLSNGTPYRVRVRAKSAGGEGAWAHKTATPAVPSLPRISLAATDSGNNPVSSVTESDADQSVTLTVSVPTNVTSDLTVSLVRDGDNSTATASADYTLAGSVTILSGSDSAAATLTVKGDQLDEDDETLTLAATATGYTKSAALALTIVDDDTAGVSVRESSTDATAVTARSVQAGETATYWLVLDSEPTASVTVTPTSGDTSKATVSGALTFSATNWATPQMVTVTGVAAGPSTVTHAVTGTVGDSNYPTSLSIGQVAVTVTASTRTFSIASVTVDEDVSGGNAVLTVTLGRNAPTGNLAFTAAYSYAGTASSADTGTTAGTVSVTAGSRTATLSVPITDDTLVEADETFTVRVSTTASGWSEASAGAGTATVTIDDDDTPAAPGGLAAAAGNAQLSLSWSPTTEVLTGYVVQYTSSSTVGNSAAARTDGDAGLGWVPGGTPAATATAHTIRDLTNGETYRVRVRAVSAAGNGVWGFTSGIPAVPVSTKTYGITSAASVREGSSASLTISLGEAAPTGGLAFTVTYGYSGDSPASAADLDSAPTRVSVTANATSVSLSVPTKADTDVEADETFTVSVRPATATGWSVASGGTAEATVTIDDDDAPAAPTGLAASGNGKLKLTWTKSSGVLRGYEVHYTSALAADVVDGAMASGNDVATGWLVSSSMVAAGDDPEHTISGLSNGTTYRVRVRAVSAGGKSGWAHASGQPAVPPQPTVTLSVASGSVTETDADETITLTATLSEAPTTAVTVSVAATNASEATASADYVLPASITVAAMASSGTANVTIKGDTVVELDEDLVLEPSAAGYDSAGTLTITIVDNDLAAAPSGLAVRGESAKLALSWTKPAGTLSGYDVHYTSASATAAPNAQAVQTGANPSASAGWVDAAHTGTDTGHTISGLINDTLYRVRVRATSDARKGAWGFVSGTPAVHAVKVSAESVAVEVGETTTYTVRLATKPAGSVTVRARSDDDDKATVSPASYTFTASDWNTAKTFTVTGVAVGAPGIDHDVQTSTDATRYPTTLSVDDIDVTVNASTKTYKIDYTGPTAEGSDAELTVTLGRAPTAMAGRALSVTYSYSGSTATTADTGTTPTTVTVGQGMTTATLTVPIAQDNLVEGAESFTVTVGAPAAGWSVPSGASATATVTIADDETENAKIAFGSDAASTAVHADSAAEDKTSPATVLVPVTVSARPQTSTSFTITAAGTATAGAAGDYTVPASVTFGPTDTAETDGSVTKNVTVTLRDDSVVELDETVELEIAAARASSHMDYDLGDRYVRHASGAKATVTIEDDEADDGPTVAFGADAAGTAEHKASVAEDVSGGMLSVPVTVSALPGASTTFEVEVLTSGTATEYDAGPPEAVGDFRITTKSVTFGPADASMTQNVSIAIQNDALVEQAQTIKLQIKAARASTDAGYDVGDLYGRDAQGDPATDTDGTSSEATVTITDDEAANAKIAFGSDAAATAKHAERPDEDVAGGKVSVPITISAAPETAVTFSVEVSGLATEGTDYTINKKSFTFTPTGALTQNLEITITDDDLVENDQAIELAIAAADSPVDDLGDYYVRHPQGRLATVTIADEDRDEAKIVIGTAVPTGTPVQYTATAAEGDGTLAVPVTISHLPESAVTFTVEAADVPDSVGKDARSSDDDDNPTGNPKDYDFAATDLEFAVDAQDTVKSKDLTIDIADDVVEEDNEFIGFQIAAADDVIDDLGDYYERVTDASTGLVTLTSDDAVSSVVLSLSGVTATAGGWFPVLEGTAVTVTATADIPVGPDGWSVAVSNPTLDQSGGFVRTQCRTNVALAGWACPSDYRLPGVFKIAEGQTQATATLTLVSDSREETTEERMSLAAVATRGARKVAARKLDLRVRENASGISIDPPSGELIPGETVTYTVSLIGAEPTADVTVTPTSGATGVATVSGALTFTAGQSGNWADPQTVTVTAVAAGDVRIAHGTSSSDAAWNQLTGLGGFSAKVNAARNVFRVDPPRDPADEGGTAELTITLGALAPTGGLTFTVDRSRANDLEYLIASPPLQTPEAGLADVSADLTSPPATVTVLENTRTVTLSDTVADDGLAEGDEHYYVVISTATAGWARETGDQLTTSRTCAQDAACARVGIADDDTADLAVAFGNAADATSAHTVAAAESAGTVSVPVTVSALPAAEVAFDVEVLTSGPDAATEGVDYTIATKRVTFGPADTSATKNLDIAITDDAVAEGDETIRLRITPARAPSDAGYGLGDRYARHQNGAQATVTITDNDGAVQISTTAVTVRADATETYTVRLTGAGPASAVTIDIASDDADKAAVSPAQLTFDSTDWQQPQTVTVTGVADGTATITHTVGGSDAAYPSSLTVASVRVTVTALPTATIAVSPNPVRETAAATVTVTLSEALAREAVIPIVVAAAVGDSPAQPGDWTPPGSVTIAAGQTRGTTTLVTVRDSDSDDEKVDVSLGALPAGLAAGSPATVRLEITDTGTGIAPPSVNTGGGPPGGGGPGGGGGGPGGGSGSSGDDREARETERLWGPDRYATSLAVAREVAAAADAKLTTVVLAGGHSWADALTAGPLAGALDAALLLTAPDGLPAGTVEWIKSLGVTEIIAVGSTEHITDTALEALADIDADIERITDPSPEATAVAVARRVGRPETLGPLLGRTVIVASSRVFVDALAAGPLAAKGPHPILLVGQDGLHPHTAAYLAEHADHVVIMGGTAAVSTEVEDQIRAISQANRAGDRPMAITRLGGTDRYDTSVKFARWLASPALEGRVCFTTDVVGLATGTDPADAAASAPLLARRCAPLVLTRPDRLPPIVASYLRRAGELIVFGGTKAINQTALDDWTH